MKMQGLRLTQNLFDRKPDSKNVDSINSSLPIPLTKRQAAKELKKIFQIKK